MTIEPNYTLEKFGYLPDQIPEFSTKPIILRCDFCSVLFERKKQQFAKPSRKEFPHACKSCDSIKSNWKRNNPGQLSPIEFYITCTSISHSHLHHVDWDRTFELFGYGKKDIKAKSEKKVITNCAFCQQEFATSLASLSRVRRHVCCAPCAAVKSEYGSDDRNSLLSPSEFFRSKRIRTDESFIQQNETELRFGYKPSKIPPGSEKKIVIRCFNCYKSFEMRMDHFTKIGPKVACSNKDCRRVKTLATLQTKYGVSNSMDIPSVKEKLTNPSTERIIEAMLRDIYKLEFERGFTIGPYSFDFYISKANLLIECQGDYFHDFKNNGYSGTPRDRSKATYVENFTNHKLVWIWEHEIHIGRVKKVLDYHIGEAKYDKITVNLNELNFRIITLQEAHSFLSLHHYLGSLGTVATPYGAFYDNELISVCVFGGVTRNGTIKKTADQLQTSLLSKQIREIRRFCIRPNVVAKNLGSYCMSKFIRLCKSHKPELTHIISFSHEDVGDTGGLYKACNFKSLGDTSPSYHYMDGQKAVHKRTVYDLAVKAKMTETEFVQKTSLVKVMENPKQKWVFVIEK